MIPKSAVNAFADLVGGVNDWGLNKMFKEASPPPKPRPRRPGPQGNKTFRAFERQKAREAELPKLNRQEQGELEARKPRIEYTNEPKRPKHRRENRDLRQRPLDKPKDFDAEKGSVRSREQMEQEGAPDYEAPQNHHILGLDQVDEAFRNTSARENKWIQNKVEEQTGLTFGNTKGNSIWLELQQHIGKGTGIHQFLRKNGLDKLSIPSNATKEQKFNAIIKLIKAMIKEGYFDELVSRTYMPKTNKLKVNKKGQMTSQGGITGMTSILP